MHGCYTSNKAKKKEKNATQFAIFTEQKKGIYKQTRTHTFIQSTHTITQQSPSVTHSVQSPISSVTQQLPPVTHLQSHMMLDTQPESILV